jgi:hypothetical protein
MLGRDDVAVRVEQLRSDTLGAVRSLPRVRKNRA